MYFDSSVNRDGMKKEKVVRAVVYIKALAQMSRPIAEFLFSLLLICIILKPDTPMWAHSRVWAYLSESSLRTGGFSRGA